MSANFHATGGATEEELDGLPNFTAVGGDWNEISDEAAQMAEERIVVNLGPVHPSTHGVYRLLIERAARAGWEHYEVSNFSLPGRFARHNSAYWTGARYIGVGPSAHSYDGRARSWNVASLPAYVAGILSGRPDREREVTDDDMRYNEYLMTRLRTMWGISLPHLRDTFGPRRLAHFLRHATPYIASGRLVRLHDPADTIRLTEEAFFVSDGIISSLFV